MSIPVRWRRPGTTWLRFQRPEGQDDRTGVDHVPQPLLEPHTPTVPTARRSASRSTSRDSQPVTPRRVVAADDWHGNTPRALPVISRLPELLPADCRSARRAGI
jgi:hypothetical protein